MLSLCRSALSLVTLSTFRGMTVFPSFGKRSLGRYKIGRTYVRRSPSLYWLVCLSSVGEYASREKNFARTRGFFLTRQLRHDTIPLLKFTFTWREITMRCIIEGCDRKATTRGLCHSCYLTALRLITAGETTWTALEQSGLCGPLMKHPNAFAAAYAKLPPAVKDLPGQTKMIFASTDSDVYGGTSDVPNS